MSLLERFHKHLLQSELLHGGERIVVGVSGGPDSLCLLHVLWRLRDELRLSIHVAHLDHGFRGQQSADEAAFVANFARELGLTATVERRDVRSLMQGLLSNSSAAARMVRYGFLAEVALTQAADAVLVAHHSDDQAETLLMHLLRGAGPGGLSGMRARTAWSVWSAEIIGQLPNSDKQPDLIRPFLPFTRAEIEHYCTQEGLDPRHDPSNRKEIYTRSRIRWELLPYLKGYNKHITQALSQTAQLCADDYDFIQSQLDQLWPSLCEERANALRFERAAWNRLHTALQRAALRRALFQLAPESDVSFEQTERLRHWLQHGQHPAPNPPANLRLELNADHWLLKRPTSQAASALPHDRPQLAAACEVALEGVTPINQDWRLVVSNSQPADWQPGPWRIVLDRATLEAGLALRTRKAGDRFQPLGGVGSRSLQDFFVDRKIAQALRAAWPLLVSGEQIVWVIGLRPDRRFYATQQSKERLWLWIDSPFLKGS
jgi:tRNA(Ile)-lysidine synthetase, N-terminal domain/tRNA(Ile)-lysidine synthetase, C-terminal domain